MLAVIAAQADGKGRLPRNMKMRMPSFSGGTCGSWTRFSVPFVPLLFWISSEGGACAPFVALGVSSCTSAARAHLSELAVAWQSWIIADKSIHMLL